MKALIVYATRRGWTKRTAETIADELESKGYLTTLLENRLPRPQQVGQYDLVIVGTSIVTGLWKARPKIFLKKFGQDIENLAIWVTAAGTLMSAQTDGLTLEDGTRMAVQRYIKPLIGKFRLHPKHVTAFGGQFSFGGETKYNNWNSEDIRRWTRSIA